MASSLTLAAAAIHKELTVGAGAANLGGVYRALPPGSDAVVQVFIATDDLTTIASQVFHAATIHFTRPLREKKLDVDVTMGSYRSGEYQTRASLLGGADSEIGSALAVGPYLADGSESADDPEVNLARYPILTANSIAFLSSTEAANYPAATAIANVFLKTFERGIVLPEAHAFHYCTWTTAVNIRGGRFETFFLHKGVRGTGEARGTDHPWGYPVYGTMLPSEYSRLVRTACGIERPRQVPEDATEIRHETGRGVLLEDARGSDFAAISGGGGEGSARA
jgi:hypothetical protein